MPPRGRFCGGMWGPGSLRCRSAAFLLPRSLSLWKESTVGSVVKKRRKRMAKKKHRKLLRKTRVQRRNKK